LEMPVPSQGHCGFPSFPVVHWFCLFVDVWILPFPLEDFSAFGNFVITLIKTYNYHNAHYLLYFIDESFIHNREAKFRILQDVLNDNI
jgi:hypothetical protein